MPYTIVEPRFVFLQYALTETAEALRALEQVRRLAGVREVRQPGVELVEWRSIIRELRTSLTAAANVSKVLWSGHRGVPRRRSATLRKICNLPTEHGLDSRTLRNHIEHTDERLDKWLASGPRPFFTIDQVIHDGLDWTAEQRAETADACVLVYDVATDSVVFLGEVFSLADLETQLVEVRDHLSDGLREIAKGWQA